VAVRQIGILFRAAIAASAAADFPRFLEQHALGEEQRGSGQIAPAARRYHCMARGPAPLVEKASPVGPRPRVGGGSLSKACR